MINFLLWILAGALVGWVASVIMRTNRRQGLIGDIVVGIVGAFVGGLILSPLFHVSTINQGNFSLPALLVSLGGAVILLAFFRIIPNIAWVLVIIILLLVIYATHVYCWQMGSSSAYCLFVRSLPFP